MPLSVMLLEPTPPRQRRMLPFVLLGSAPALYILWELIAYPLTHAVQQDSVFYFNAISTATLVAERYVISTCGALFLAAFRGLVTLGWLNLIGLLGVMFIRRIAFTSVWCAYAAAVSVILHFISAARVRAGRRATRCGTRWECIPGALESHRTTDFFELYWNPIGSRQGFGPSAAKRDHGFSIGKSMALKSSNASTARVESSFKQLSTAAQTLHSASDDLRKVIRQLDASLKKLGLGFPAWVQISGSSDEVQYWNRDLGYARVGGKWGLALRDVTGNHIDNEDDAEEVWAFNDAPRAMRIEAVGKIPDLLEKLLQQTEETTKKLQAKIAQASELASIFADLTGGVPALPSWSGRQGGGLSLDAGVRSTDIEGNGAEKSSHHFRDAAQNPASLPAERTAPAERVAAGERALPVERTDRPVTA